MSDTETPLYKIPELDQQQSQPHIPINEGWRRIEAILSRVLSRAVNDPRSLSPNDADSYIVAAASFSVVGVDTSNDIVTVPGDQTSRMEDNQLIEIVDSTGNDGIYEIVAGGLTYDSTNDETDIEVAEDITDSTVDGDVLHVAGSWNGQRQSVAYWQGSAWLFIPPFEGAGPLWVNDEDKQVRYNNGWVLPPGGGVGAEDNGSIVVQQASAINFNSNLSVTDDGDGTVSVDGSPAGVDAEDGGTVVVSGATAFNFGPNMNVADDGDGTVTVTTIGSINWKKVSSAYTASVNERILADTSGGAFTITMPSSPSVGDTVYFADSARSWGANNLTVDGNGNNVVGNSTLEVDVSEWNFSLVYNGTQWVFGDTSGNLFQAPENATDSGTDAYVSDSTTSTPTAGVVISRDFQSANTTSTPTLDSVSIVSRDGSSIWAGALNRVHRLLYDGTNYILIDPYNLNSSPALENSDLASNGGSVAQIATGTYTGDGTTSNSITGIGFQPKFIEIYRRETTDATGTQVYRTTPEIIDDNADGAAHRIASSTNAIQSQIKTNGIISFDSDGFTVDDAGSDSDPNTDGQIYNYWAMG